MPASNSDRSGPTVASAPITSDLSVRSRVESPMANSMTSHGTDSATFDCVGFAVLWRHLGSCRGAQRRRPIGDSRCGVTTCDAATLAKPVLRR